MRYLIGTNIKMYLGYRESLRWLADMNRDVPETYLVEVALFPPMLSLVNGRDLISKNNVSLGAQNVCWSHEGPYTGEISPLVLRELGIPYAELGHHERRLHFNETDRTVAKKISAALFCGLKALVCVGEDADRRDSGAEEFARDQIQALLASNSDAPPERLVVAYEPRWAIGVAEAAPPEHARRCCDAIRGKLVEIFGPRNGREIRIIYGGSVKLEDAADMLEQKNINGLFIGRAALDTKNFAKVVKIAARQAEADQKGGGAARRPASKKPRAAKKPRL
ncbi:MAG: triose-phosphate isomerase [Deltaproteobacteria bacterium]|jgi:triosephosphate isomerase|nr:triose-phosphate isomerase [Deltaproteobacteria bacterium]